MVDADIIYLIQLVADAFNPPAISVLFMCFPVIEGVTPQLSLSSKIIWRNSGYFQRMSLGIQAEHTFICPDISTVRGGEDRNITDDGNSFFICIILQCIPLTEEAELYEAVIVDFFFQKLKPGSAFGRCRIQETVFPLIPGQILMIVFSCHVEAVVFQPEFIIFLEGIIFLQQILI